MNLRCDFSKFIRTKVIGFFYLLFVGTNVFSLNLHAQNPVQFNEDVFASYSHVTNRLRIGTSWDRTPVQRHVHNPVSELILKSMMRVRAGSGILLGNYEGNYLIMTAGHVLSNCHTHEGLPSTWEEIDIYHPFFNVYFLCQEILIHSPEHDLTIFLASYNGKPNVELNTFRAQLSLDTQLFKTPLVATGFTMVHSGTLTVDYSDDCRILSPSGIVEKIKDPDIINPTSMHVYSIAHGCDVAHGDSGGAIFNRNNGKVEGLLWTIGQIPRSSSWLYSNRVADTFDHLYDIFSYDKDVWFKRLIWSQLNYAVPTPAIMELVRNKVNQLQKNLKTQKDITRYRVLSAFLNHHNHKLVDDVSGNVK